jgi:hypothetical protein
MGTAGRVVADSEHAYCVESEPSPRVLSLDELIRQAKVDLELWAIERHVINKWEAGAKDLEGNIVVKPLWQVKAWLRPLTEPPIIREIWAAMLADIRAERSAKAKPLRLKLRGDRHLLELGVVDVHVGKLSWAEEVGQDYDVQLAETAFVEAVEDLLRKASGFPVEQIILLIGNDLFHVDNLLRTTTGGTPQDADSRYAKMFRRGRRMQSWALRRAAEIAPVVGKIIPGNHDRQSTFCLGEVLGAEFADHPNVTIDNSPNLRKYHRYGTNLLGWTHGSEEKHNDLPLIMAQERPQDWAETTHREFHLGHLHKAKETRYVAGDSFNGVRVRILPALTATDAWHYSKGYSDRRCAEAYLFNHDTGYAAHFSGGIVADRAA